MKPMRIRDFQIGPGEELAIIVGPCVIESEEACLSAALQLKEIMSAAGLPWIFKSSFDKANRSSLSSYRGPGLKEGLRILKRIRDEVGVPVVTDIHEPQQAAPVAEVCELIQIPAFLCRQTDLLVAAAKTGRPLSVKKGQFMAPWDMKNVIHKISESGNSQILLTDRGTVFGYNNLVTDFRGLPLMRALGYPVCYDASHSIQLPGGQGTCSGGDRSFIPVLARAAVAAGCDCVYVESHPDPAKALCDGPSMIPFAELPELLSQLKQIHEVLSPRCSAVC